ncbi:MAG: hypothetical protein VR73_14860 [Gammaproteobacteria bacterium BRH_c0]|nr:MAG: hypothetical protein VR73_14860 [Gammaproteobacteria bacterium BRH_c0]
MNRSLLILAALLLSAGMSACSPLGKPPADNLYQRLGGEQGIEALVYDLLVEIAADERIVERFRDVNIPRFRQGLESYICSISGGPCEYSGESMQVVHAGHGYTDVEFNALVDDLIRAMEKRQLPVATQNRLLALLAPSYRDIVYQ